MAIAAMHMKKKQHPGADLCRKGDPAINQKANFGGKRLRGADDARRGWNGHQWGIPYTKWTSLLAMLQIFKSMQLQCTAANPRHHNASVQIKAGLQKIVVKRFHELQPLQLHIVVHRRNHHRRIECPCAPNMCPIVCPISCHEFPVFA